MEGDEQVAKAPLILYLGSVLMVLFGFINILFSKGIIHQWDSGTGTVPSITLIILGIIFFMTALGEQNKKKSVTRKTASIIFFVIVIGERLLILTQKNIFDSLLIIIFFWVLYRLFTRRHVTEEDIITENEEMKEREKQGRIRSPLPIRIASTIHYILGIIALGGGIYLLVRPEILFGLGESRIDVVMGVMLGGLIFLLLGFAIAKGSKVIRFFVSVAWILTIIRILEILQIEGITYIYLTILICGLFVLDTFFFNIRSRIYFEKMS